MVSCPGGLVHVKNARQILDLPGLTTSQVAGATFVNRRSEPGSSMFAGQGRLPVLAP